MHDDFLSLVRFLFFAEQSTCIVLCETLLSGDKRKVRRVMLTNISSPFGMLQPVNC
jgi:hypothetical protein